MVVPRVTAFIAVLPTFNAVSTRWSCGDGEVVFCGLGGGEGKAYWGYGTEAHGATAPLPTGLVGPEVGDSDMGLDALMWHGLIAATARSNLPSAGNECLMDPSV